MELILEVQKILSSNGNADNPQISSSGNAVRIVWSRTVMEIMIYFSGQVEMKGILSVVSKI